MVDSYNIDFIRSCFPLFKEGDSNQKLVYFDNAASAQKPYKMIDALTSFYKYEYATVHRAVYDLAAKSTEKYTRVRELVKDFIHAKSEDEIIFTKGTTQGINIVANSFAKPFFKEGDEIVITEAEHHSNIVPWQVLAEEKKLQLRVLPVDSKGDISLDELKNLISEKTKLISVAMMTNTTGTIYPVKEIIDIAHQVGAKVLVDAAQGATHIAIDVLDLDVDFLVFSSHKLYGPTGVGVLYGKKKLLDQMTPYEYGGDMVDQVSFEKTTFQSSPLKFEAGTPMFAQIVAFGASIEFLQSVGVKAISTWETQLLKYATEKLLTIDGLRILGQSKTKGPIITFAIDGVHSLDLGTILGLKGFCLRTGKLCAEPILDRFGVSTVSRISFGMYNTFEEIDAFYEALIESSTLLKSDHLAIKS